MEDGPIGAWTLDPEIRTAMRLDRVRTALATGAWTEVVLEAEELLDEQPDHAEALELLGEALLRGGEYELARAAFDHRVALDGGNVPALVGLAVASFHLTDLQTTLETAREALRRDSGHARAHYFLGLALERTPGRQREALASLTAAAHLDPVECPLPFTVRNDRWPELYERALAHLPERLREVWRGVPVRIEEWPELDELRKAVPPLSPLTPAMYVGTPAEDGDPFDSKPEAVRLFTRNLARAGDAEALVEELAHALGDEALDWLGLDIEDVEDEE